MRFRLSPAELDVLLMAAGAYLPPDDEDRARLARLLRKLEAMQRDRTSGSAVPVQSSEGGTR